MRNVVTVKGDRSFQFVMMEELIKFAILHELDVDAIRLVDRADPQQRFSGI